MQLAYRASHHPTIFFLFILSHPFTLAIIALYMSKHYVVYMHTICYIDDDTDTVILFYNHTKVGILKNIQKYMQNRKEKLHHKKEVKTVHTKPVPTQPNLYNTKLSNYSLVFSPDKITLQEEKYKETEYQPHM